MDCTESGRTADWSSVDEKRTEKKRKRRQSTWNQQKNWKKNRPLIARPADYLLGRFHCAQKWCGRALAFTGFFVTGFSFVCVCVCVAAGVGWRQRRSADPAGSDPGNEASLNETSDRPRLICMLICIDFAPRRTAVPDFSIRFSFLFSFFLFLFLFVLPSNWVCDLNGSHRGMQSFRVGAFRLRTRGAAGKKKEKNARPHKRTPPETR